jgi:hypothetical protein
MLDNVIQGEEQQQKPVYKPRIERFSKTIMLGQKKPQKPYY